jgi:hypothetical protein
MDQEGLKLLLSVNNTLGSKLSKKQADVDVLSMVGVLVNASGLKRHRMSLQHFMGSMAIFASAVRGLCFVYDKRVEIFVHDCEIVAIRKPEQKLMSIVPRPSTGAKRRMASVSAPRRQSTSSVVSIAPVPEAVDLETVMDLDSLCADLNRRSSVLSGPQITPVPRGKKSRSGSSVSEDDAFDAADIPFEEINLDVGPLPALDDQPIPEAIPTRAPAKNPRKQLKGLTPKIGMTNLEYSKMLRADAITNKCFSMTPADYAREGPLDISKIRRFLYPAAEETVSIAEAVDLDSVIDELRVEDPDIDFMDEVVPRRERPSLDSTFADNSRRQSLASDIFVDDIARKSTILGEAEELKIEIKNALEHRHAKKGTMIGFSDIVPTGCTSRRVAAGVFVQLLVLATRSEIRFKQQEKNTFADEMFFVMGNEDSSSSSSD